MGLGEYKTIQTSATEVATLLKELSVRLERLEARMAALETRVAPQGGASARMGERAFPLAPTSGMSAGTHGVSVSGSATPTAMMSNERELLLAPADEQIVNLIRARGHVCATDVQVKFKYKGKNAASARLSRLYELGLLEKSHAGRTVFYRMRTPG